MIKKCVQCGEEFETYDRPHIGKGARSGKCKRPWNAITCSPECSKKWNRRDRHDKHSR